MLNVVQAGLGTLSRMALADVALFFAVLSGWIRVRVATGRFELGPGDGSHRPGDTGGRIAVGNLFPQVDVFRLVVRPSRLHKISCINDAGETPAPQS